MADQDVQGMLIRIEATTAQLRRELTTADRAVGDTSQKIDKNLGKADGAFDRLNATAVSALKGILLPLASVGTAVAGLTKAVDVQRQFDKLNAGLITATGSAENAASAFGAIQEFAQKTPYDLNQAVEGFTQLVNLGLTPSENALMSYGNTASALGKDLSQMIEAVADAATGEFERLKEFGITASQNGDKVALTFQGITQSIGNNAGEIENYLIGLGENQFAGAMAARMATLDGAISNLGDSWEQLFRNINEAGLGELMREQVDLASSALNDLNAALSSGQLEAYLKTIGDKFDGFSRDVSVAIGIIQQSWMEATDEIQRGGMADAGEEVVNFITGAFRNLPENVRAFVQLMVTEVAVGLDKAAAYARAFKESTKAIFTDDTQAAVAARLQDDLERINGVRADSIASILAERDAALQSFSDRIKAADQLRKKYNAEQAAAAQATADRLAQYKKVGAETATVSTETEKAAKAFKDFLTTAERATISANLMADAYLGGANNVRELSIQEKVEQELLKTGVGARDAVTKAIREQQNATDRLDLGKLIADTRQQTVDLQAQTAVLIANSRSVTDGTVAQSAYNIEKSVLAALADKDASALQNETAEIKRQATAQEEARKELEAHREIADLIDSTATAQEKLNRQITHLNELMAQAKTPEEIAAIQRAMQQAQNETSQWAQFTERQLDRVDQAFSDAWLNIGHGFDSFASSLKRAFEQMLAELAHMAITKPIVLQIGSALGLGGLSGSTVSSGIWSSISGGSGLLGSLGGLSSILSGGLDTGLGQVVGRLLYGGASTYAPVSFQVESALSKLGASAGSFAAQLGISEEALAKFGAALGVVGDVASVAGAAYNVYSGFKDGIANGLTTLAGAAIGTFFGGPVGSAIGSTIGKFVGGALFGTWKIKDYGLALGVNNGDLTTQSYVYKKKSGLFSHKKKTTYDPLGGDLAQQLQDTFSATEDGVASIFEQLGYSIDDGTYAGLKIARKKISTKGKTQDEISQAIGDWFTSAGESINTYLNTTLGTGLDYDVAGMTTFVNNLYTVNDILDHLNVGLFSTDVAGGKLVEQLLADAGGLDTLTSSVSTYYAQFFSDAEQQANTLADVIQVFADANQVLPATRAGYRALVESLDLTTASGQQLFATLMDLSGQADSYYDIVEQRASDAQTALDSWTSDLVDAAGTAFDALKTSLAAQQQTLTDAYNAQVTSLNDLLDTASSTVSSLTSIGSSLEAALTQLAGTSAQTTTRLHDQAVATLRNALAFAQAGGALSDFTGLQDALNAAVSLDAGNYATQADMQREQGRTAGLIAALQSANAGQLTTEQSIVASLQAQLDQAQADYQLQTAALDAQLSAAQAQLDALQGIDAAVQSVAAALDGFAQALAAAQGATATPTVDSVVASVYQSVLGRTPSAAEVGYWTGQIGTGATDLGSLSTAVAASAGQVPAFASGGLHSGGLRLVGENGPELEVTGPSRIYPAGQTAELLSGGTATAEEVRGLRADMGRVFDALRAIAKHTMQTATRTEFLERWDFDGLPSARS